MGQTVKHNLTRREKKMTGTNFINVRCNLTSEWNRERGSHSIHIHLTDV